MEDIYNQIESEIIVDDEFIVVAPLGSDEILLYSSADCEVCCPGSCTGCTKCNSCNITF